MRNGLLAQIRLDTALDAEPGQLICICRNVLAFRPQRQQGEKQCKAGAGGNWNRVERDAPCPAIEIDVEGRAARSGLAGARLSLRGSGGLGGGGASTFLGGGGSGAFGSSSGRGSSFAVSVPLWLSGLT